MQIGFDAKRLFTNKTGLGNYSRRLVQALVDHHPGVEIHLFTPGIDPAYRTFAGLGTVHKPLRKIPFWRQFGIARAIRASNVQVYHGLSAELPMRIPRGVKTVLTVHDVLFRRFPSFYKLPDRLIYHLKLKRAIRRADHIIAISEATRRDLENYYGVEPGRVEVIPVICRFEVHRPKSIYESGKFPRFILCISRFEKRKNHLNLLRAYALLPSYTRPKLVLIGAAGDTLDAVQTFILMNRLSNDVIIRPYASDEDLIHFYDTCELFVFPSLFEGFGMPVAEAMQRECVVCTSKDTSMAEITGPYGFLFDPNDPEDMARTMHAALQPEAKEEKLDLLPAQLDKLDAKQVSRRYVEAYKRLIG